MSVSVEANLAAVRRRIREAAESCRRDYRGIELVCVSKGHSTDAIRQAVCAGERVFGESYVTEAVRKIEDLKSAALEWHFIGAIQSNKCKRIAADFDWVHSVPSFDVADRLSRLRPAGRPPLNVLIQVNIDQEPAKSGVGPENVLELAGQIVKLPAIALRGLMAIPAKRSIRSEQDSVFERCGSLFGEMQRRYGAEQVSCLSLGMSGDLEAAIAAGATHIRVGTSIFGPRFYARPGAEGVA